MPGMEPTEVDVDELIEFWTLLDEDRELLAGKRFDCAGVRVAVEALQPAWTVPARPW